MVEPLPTGLSWLCRALREQANCIGKMSSFLSQIEQRSHALLVQLYVLPVQLLAHHPIARSGVLVVPIAGHQRHRRSVSRLIQNEHLRAHLDVCGVRLCETPLGGQSALPPRVGVRHLLPAQANRCMLQSHPQCLNNKLYFHVVACAMHAINANFGDHPAAHPVEQLPRVFGSPQPKPPKNPATCSATCIRQTLLRSHNTLCASATCIRRCVPRRAHAQARDRAVANPPPHPLAYSIVLLCRLRREPSGRRNRALQVQESLLRPQWCCRPPGSE